MANSTPRRQVVFPILLSRQILESDAHIDTFFGSVAAYRLNLFFLISSWPTCEPLNPLQFGSGPSPFVHIVEPISHFFPLVILNKFIYLVCEMMMNIA